MASPDMSLAIPVLRNNAPRYSHEVRHACFAAADYLEGITFEPDNPVAVSIPVKNAYGKLLGHAQMMLTESPDGPIGTSSWFTPVEGMIETQSMGADDSCPPLGRH